VKPSLKLDAEYEKSRSRLKLGQADPSQLPSSWEFIMDNRVYTTGADGTFPRRGIDSVSQRAISRAIRRLVDAVGGGAGVGRQRRLRRAIQFRRLVYAFRRFSPRLGVDYVLDLLMTYKRLGASSGEMNNSRRKISVRRHSYVRVPFLGWQVWERRLPRELPVVHFVVPLKGRLATFERFLSNWNDVCPLLKSPGSFGRRCTLTVSQSNLEVHLSSFTFSLDPFEQC
jgi:chondroitin sulfate synthase